MQKLIEVGGGAGLADEKLQKVLQGTRRFAARELDILASKTDDDELAVELRKLSAELRERFKCL